MKKLLFFISFAVLFAACESQIDIKPVNLDFETPDIIATLPDQTRTFLGEGNTIYWNVGDQLTVFSKSDHNLKYEIAELEEGSTTARFTYTREYVLGSGKTHYYYLAAYPFNEETVVTQDYILTIKIPSVQQYDANQNFKHIPLTAISTSMNMNFVAPSSALRVRVNKDNPNTIILKKIVVSSASQNIAGLADIDMKVLTPVAVINDSIGIPSQSITLDFGDGVELTEERQIFYMALPAVNFGVNDLKITCVYDMNGDEFKASKTYDKEVNFKVASINSTNLTITNPDVNGSTVDGDLVVDGDMELDEPLVVPSGDVTITLNDGAILTNSASNPNSALIVVEEDATLTIEGEGSITTVAPEAQATTLSTTRATFNSAFPIVVNGTLRIKGGDFTLNSYATSWLDCGIYIGPNGKLIVEGGTFRSTKGSYIFGHEFGSRPEISIVGGCFEGYDPSDNDFDGEGSNYLEPEYASYYVAEDELVVASRTAEWEVDNSYLLNSILKNGGKVTLIDSIENENNAFFVEPDINIRHDVEICASSDPTKVSGTCNFYLDNAMNCFANVTFICDHNQGDIFGSGTYLPNERMLCVDSLNDIANVYDGATLTLGDARYWAGTDSSFDKAFTLYGGNIVVNGGEYLLYDRVRADNMFVVDANYADSSSLLVNDGVFNGFDPERVTFGEEVKNCVVDGKGAVISFDGGHHTIEDRVGTFTAATYNVDGLPEKVLSIFTLNGDGPGSAGTTTISEKVNATGWDFVAFQENFSYNTELQSKMTNYTFGKHREFSILNALGTADTDGQNFATRNESCKFTSETMVEFVAKEGGLTNGANTSIKKGIRHYVVEFTSGLVIDVLTTHMNTADNDAQIAAQNDQLTEVANYINSIRSNNRPIIFMGDMNTRYTRNDYETYFWNVLDSGLRCDDPWVEYQWNNYYPVLGSDSIMTGDYGMQKGEIVDKIICINNPDASVRISADTYLHDEAFGDVADHKPVVVKFSFYNM